MQNKIYRMWRQSFHTPIFHWGIFVGMSLLLLSLVTNQISSLETTEPGFFNIPKVLAATVNAASCSNANVQSAINSAADGDTVNIPAGSCSWGGTTVSMNGKAVNVLGAGIGATNISLSGGGFSMSGSSSGGNVGSFGGVTFTGSSNANGWIDISSSFRFRLHHIAIGDVSNRAILITGSYGLIDHMQFTTNSGYNAIQILGSQFTPSGRWNSTTVFGDANAVFIEDNTYTATNCVNSLGTFDAFNGGKVVFRHNTVTNWSAYNHGFDSASESGLLTEIYNNDLRMSAVPCPIPRYFWIRGGTGVIHDNTLNLVEAFNQYQPKLISAYYYRSESSQQGQGICNGSVGIDGNTPGQNGWVCFQQPGAAGGNGGTTSVPWYEWNNVGTGNMPANMAMASEFSQFQSGRDFFNDTQKPGYVAYTYPHPFQSGSPTPPPPPPPPPTFDFTMSNGGNKSVVQGSSTTNTVTATLSSGTTTAVSFSTSGLPTGASASYSPTSCNPTCTTTVTITTSGSTPVATSTITITGTAGATVHTTTFSLTVTGTADTVAPSIPTNLSAAATSSSQINLTWTASTDNVGVTGYKVFRNGSQVGTPATNSYSDIGLTASTTYSYTVSANDAAGNNSAQSGSASGTTQAPGTGTSYYIDQTAGNDANNGTSTTSPWKNAPGMAACASLCASTSVQPGSTIYFDRADTWSVSGSQGIWLLGGVTYLGDSWGTGTRATIRAAANLDAGVVRFRDHATFSTIFKGFDVNANNTVSTGIDINHRFSSPMTGALKRVENVIVHNVTSSQSAGQYKYGIIASSFNGDRTANVEILNSVVHDTSRDGINLYPGDNSASNLLSNVTVRGNESYNTGQDAGYCCGAGFLIKGHVTNATLEYNYAHNNKGAAFFVNSNETTHFGVGISNLHIRYNVLTNSTNNGAFRVYDGSGGSDPKDIKFYGNVVYNSTVLAGLYFGADQVGTETIYVYNNTFYNAPVDIENSSANYSTFEFKNNIVFGGAAIVGSNKFTANANNVTTNPTFKNTANLPTGFTGTYPNLVPNNDGLSLLAGSNSLDAGATLASAYNLSINSVSRPQGSAFDVGAYESSSGAPLTGDLNGDHIINSIDYSLFNSKWFTTDAASDFNHDGLVNSIDFSMMNANWLRTW